MSPLNLLLFLPTGCENNAELRDCWALYIIPTSLLILGLITKRMWSATYEQVRVMLFFKFPCALNRWLFILLSSSFIKRPPAKNYYDIGKWTSQNKQTNFNPWPGRDFSWRRHRAGPSRVWPEAPGPVRRAAIRGCPIWNKLAGARCARLGARAASASMPHPCRILGGSGPRPGRGGSRAPQAGRSAPSVPRLASHPVIIGRHASLITPQMTDRRTNEPAS